MRGTGSHDIGIGENASVILEAEDWVLQLIPGKAMEYMALARVSVRVLPAPPEATNKHTKNTAINALRKDQQVHQCFAA